MAHQSAGSVGGWTANDRLKMRFGGCFWKAILLAAGVHYVVLSHAPVLVAEDYSIDSSLLEKVRVPPEVEIPPPPEPIQRPAVPLMSTSLEVDADRMTEPRMLESLRTEPPPPPVQSADLSDQPSLTPYEVGRG